MPREEGAPQQAVFGEAREVAALCRNHAPLLARLPEAIVRRVRAEDLGRLEWTSDPTYLLPSSVRTKVYLLVGRGTSRRLSALPSSVCAARGDRHAGIRGFREAL